MQKGFRLINSVAPLGNEILGVDGKRKYLVLGQSADELRGTGGFVSALWLVTFENGSLSEIQYHDTVRVDDWENLNL